MTRRAFFAAILLLPALGASTAQLPKTLLVAVAGLVGVWTLRDRHPGFVRGGGTAFWLVVGVMLLALVSTLLTPFYVFDGLVGSQSRFEGWLSVTAALAVGFTFWRGDGDDREMFSRVLVGLVLTVIGLRLVGGWEVVEKVVGTKMGVATMCAACLPIVVGWGCSKMRGSWQYGWECYGRRPWIAGLAGLGACAVIVESGTRSALLGLVAGVGFLLCRWWRRSVVIGLAVLGLPVLLAVSHPLMRERLAKACHGQIGHGPRAHLVSQFWNHGMTWTGWGMEAQRHLVDRQPHDGLEPWAVYDRWHMWPLDVASTVGVLGLVAVLVIIWIVLRLSWTAPAWDWWQPAFGGSVVAFLVCSMWNPPALQGWLLNAIVLSGLCTRTMAPSKTSGWIAAEIECARKMFLNWFRWGFGAVCLAGCLVYGSLYAGNVLSVWAVKRHVTSMPHAVLGRHWIASKLNPWTKKEYVIAYLQLHGDRRFSEPEGGKVMLRMLQRQHDSTTSLKAALWLGFGEQQIAAKWLEVSRAEWAQKRKWEQ